MRRKHVRFPWVVAGSVAGIVLMAGGLWLRLPPPPAAPVRPPPPTLSLIMGNVTSEAPLDDQVYLLDPTPLFLPSEVSSSQSVPPPGQRPDRSETLMEFPAVLTFPVDDVPVVVAPRPTGPLTVVGALAAQPSLYTLQGLGRKDIEQQPLPTRLAMVEIYEAGNGKLVSRNPVIVDAADTEGLDLPSFWAPSEVLVAVDRAGLSVPPTVIASSGSAEADEFFKNYLEKPYRIGQRLRPGFYRLQVGP